MCVCCLPVELDELFIRSLFNCLFLWSQNVIQCGRKIWFENVMLDEVVIAILVISQRTTRRHPHPPKVANTFFFGHKRCAMFFETYANTIFWFFGFFSFDKIFIFSFRDRFLTTLFRNANQRYPITSWLRAFNPKAFGGWELWGWSSPHPSCVRRSLPNTIFHHKIFSLIFLESWNVSKKKSIKIGANIFFPWFWWNFFANVSDDSEKKKFI